MIDPSGRRLKRAMYKYKFSILKTLWLSHACKPLWTNVDHHFRRDYFRTPHPIMKYWLIGIPLIMDIILPHKSNDIIHETSPIIHDSLHLQIKRLTKLLSNPTTPSHSQKGSIAVPSLPDNSLTSELAALHSDTGPDDRGEIAETGEMGKGLSEQECGCHVGFLSHGGTPNHQSHGWRFWIILVLNIFKPMVTWGAPHFR